MARLRCCWRCSAPGDPALDRAPLAAVTRVTEAVAGGDATLAVPLRDRRDEIGALARSIAVFQDAMRRNDELS